MHRNEKDQFPDGLFGNSAGRPRSSCNRLGQAFIAALCADWIENGAAVIAQVRREQPAAYLKMVWSLLPRQPNIKEDNLFDGVTDEELADFIAFARHALRTLEGGDSEPGSAAQ
jgi:hypothetical protein